MNARIGIVLISIIALTGCSAGAAKNAGFIRKPQRMSKPGDLPFQKVWVKAEKKYLKDYSELYVAPVSTDFVKRMSWWKEAVKDSNIKQRRDLERRLSELGSYTQKNIQRAFRQDPNKRFRIVSRPGSKTAILEMALVEIVPSNTALGALGIVPHPAAKLITKAGNNNYAAFEARIRDGGTKEVIASFADKENAPTRVVDTTQMSEYGPVRGIIDDWIEQFVKAANRKPGEIVSDPMFALKAF